MSHARANTIDVSEPRSAKRRKVAGLNTRFDRMIKSVNTMLSYRTSSPTSSRKRMQSSGTSSVSSHDIPKTPLDADGGFHLGKLGNDFSVLKMKSSLLLARDDVDGFPKPVAPPKEPRGPLPDWLANTFCSLEAGHPLRGLLSPSRIHANSKPISPSTGLGVSHEEKIFAFSPFDKQEETPDPNTAYRADDELDVQRPFQSKVPSVKRTLSHPQLEASINPLPFSTPGRFAPVRKLTQRSIVDSTFQKPLFPVHETFHSTNTMNSTALPVSHLRPDDVIGCQLTQGFSNLVQDTGSPSDLNENVDNANHRYQVFQSGCDDLNVYVTPGPTFACSRSVYFDSPIEDPSLSDPLQPESYELDLNAIDFRWRPFLRSNPSESDTNGHFVSSSSLLGHAVPNRVMVDDQGGWNARLAVDKGEDGTSSEDLPSLADEVGIVYPNNQGAIRPGKINNPTRTWSSQINDVQLKPALLAAPRVQPRADGEKKHAGDKNLPLHGEETKVFGSEAYGIRPSTPIRQVAVSPPSTPHKLRSSRLCEIPRAPIRKTSSALSWMIPPKHPERTTAVRGEADGRLANVSVSSSDSIES